MLLTVAGTDESDKVPISLKKINRFEKSVPVGLFLGDDLLGHSEGYSETIKKL